MFDRRRSSFLSSALLHVGLLIVLLTVFSAPPVRRWATGTVRLLMPVEVRLRPPSLSGGGGGSGSRDPLPASRGRLPRFDVTSFVSPAAAPLERPRLALEPTLIGSADAVAPMNLAVFGDPLANVGPPSSGSGSQGGIGDGGPGGVGPGGGPGYGGEGENGCCGGIYRIGGVVSAPRLLRRVEPEYSDEARKAKWQGTVVLAVEVWPDGRAHSIRVLKALGMGLDERAIAAVERWIFEPGRKDGQAVKVRARVEVNFRLL